MKRTTTLLGLLATFAVGAYLSYEASQLFLYRASFSGSYKYNLLFTSAGWLLPIAIFLGIYAGATAKRKDSVIVDGKVLRHDETAFLIHWSHALSTVLLIGTGICLGFLFIPRLVNTPQEVGFALNLHFVGALVFLFAVAAHMTDVVLTGKFREHLPEAGDLQDALAHYAAKLGIGEKPREGKYLASERLSYPMWLVTVGLVLVTGLVKVSAHIGDISPDIMGVMTLLHDVSALLIGLNLIVHIIMSSILPWSWPLLKSMLSGYVPVSYAKKHHIKWYEELTGSSIPENGQKKASKTVQKGV